MLDRLHDYWQFGVHHGHVLAPGRLQVSVWWNPKPERFRFIRSPLLGVEF